MAQILTLPTRQSHPVLQAVVLRKEWGPNVVSMREARR